MEIRRAVPSDAPLIASAEERIFSDPWKLSDVLGAISQSGSMCYVATSDGALMAYIIGRTVMPEGEIYRIATLEEFRRRGIAYRLLDYAHKTERGRGLESLFLEVREKNAAARALYAAHGFSEIGVRRGYYKDPPDNAILMIKTDTLEI